ncbi:hypothetical protein RYA05_02930 [Pseudomonas syringae pv. actinidiae]|nr:hypothetical protein [Pseudomonas syringae pv. actinidiae]
MTDKIEAKFEACTVEKLLNVFNAPSDVRFVRQASATPSEHGSALRVVFKPTGFWFHEPVALEVKYTPEHAVFSSIKPALKVGKLYIEAKVGWGTASGISDEADRHESSLAFAAALTAALELKEQILAMVKAGHNFHEVALPCLCLDMKPDSLSRESFSDCALLISGERLVFQHMVFESKELFLSYCESQDVHDIPVRDADDCERNFWNYIAFIQPQPAC